MSAGSEAAAASVLARLRVLSGRAAQLESSYRVLETDLQARGGAAHGRGPNGRGERG